ncbi:MAG: hypothetical protein M3362_27900, partial [Acidobacteriota bacterium]|nr:hypothetical protein [Acidobacteriota bacterium]
MGIQEILHRLENIKRSGKEWSARCPAHDDQHNSLSIAEGQDGKLLMHCHAGCTYEGINEALGLSFNDEQRRANQDVSSYLHDAEAVAIYPYYDENRDLLYRVSRFNPKTFRPSVPDGNGGFKRGLPPDVRRVLYRLPELLASDPSTTVFIVEGEKDVETLHKHGLIATCNVGGAGKWRDEYNEFLRGRLVCILPDNDKPGIEHARKVAQSLRGIAASVRTVDLFAKKNREEMISNEPSIAQRGKDVSDWFDMGHSAEELQAIVNHAPIWNPYDGT